MKTGPQMMLEQMMKSIGFEPDKIKASLVEAKDAIQSQVQNMVRDIELNRELIAALDLKIDNLSMNMDIVFENEEHNLHRLEELIFKINLSLTRIELKLETIPVSELVKIPRPTEEEIARVLGMNEFGFASDIPKMEIAVPAEIRSTTSKDGDEYFVAVSNDTTQSAPKTWEEARAEYLKQSYKDFHELAVKPVLEVIDGNSGNSNSGSGE